MTTCPFGAQDTDALAALDRVLALQRNAHLRAPYPDEALRRDRLQRLLALVKTNREAFASAISADFGGRSKVETLAFEVLTCVDDIRHTLKHLRRWMEPQRRAVGLTTWPARARLLRQPLGVIGVIVPWNYPLYLAVSPIVGALGAGNRVMVKMSEHTPRFSALFADLVAKAFAEDEVFVVNGGAAVAQAFSALPFDHILFTGSTAVGRQVMQAAATNLTPVTLELGGKSPTLIGDDVDLDKVAASVLFGKLVNAGQTCIAPDYVLLPRQHERAFLVAARRAVQRHYPRLQGNVDYSSVINERQAQRLRRYVDDARERGAQVHALHDDAGAKEGRQLLPLAVTGVQDNMLLMQEEIFGPLLPVVLYDRFEDAIAHVNRHTRPLALYLFTKDESRIDAVLKQTTSGGVVVNDVMLHVVQNDLPFGGVGASGMGHYHGKEGFETFSKSKGVLYQSRFNAAALIRPPYGNGRLQRLALFLIGR